VPTTVALYILNNKRAALAELEQRHNLRLTLSGDDALIPPDYRMERSKTQLIVPEARAPISQPDTVVEDEDIPDEEETASASPAQERPAQERPAQEADGGRRRSRRRRRGRRDEVRPPQGEAPGRFAQPPLDDAGVTAIDASEAEREDGVGPALAGEASDEARPGGDMSDQDAEMQRRRRRRGRRGGRRRRRGNDRQPGTQLGEEGSAGMAPREEQAPSDRPVGNWTGESDQPPYRYDADTPGEPAIEATTRDDDRSPFSIRADESSDAPRAPEVEHEPVQPSHRSEPVVAADSNGSGAAAAVAGPETEPEREPVDQPPSGPPKRGWWKRLIE
jgi:ribonuclease E